jgi:hypothetical protein
MKVGMDDGEEMEYNPGGLAIIAPGHDAWTVRDEPRVVIDGKGSPTTPTGDLPWPVHQRQPLVLVPEGRADDESTQNNPICPATATSQSRLLTVHIGGSRAR